MEDYRIPAILLVLVLVIAFLTFLALHEYRAIVSGEKPTAEPSKPQRSPLTGTYARERAKVLQDLGEEPRLGSPGRELTTSQVKDPFSEAVSSAREFEKKWAFPEALAEYEKALAIREDDTVKRRSRAAALIAEAISLENKRRLVDAIDAYQSSLRLAEISDYPRQRIKALGAKAALGDLLAGARKSLEDGNPARAISLCNEATRYADKPEEKKELSSLLEQANALSGRISQRALNLLTVLESKGFNCAAMAAADDYLSRESLSLAGGKFTTIRSQAAAKADLERIRKNMQWNKDIYEFILKDSNPFYGHVQSESEDALWIEVGLDPALGSMQIFKRDIQERKGNPATLKEVRTFDAAQILVRAITETNAGHPLEALNFLGIIQVFYKKAGFMPSQDGFAKVVEKLQYSGDRKIEDFDSLFDVCLEAAENAACEQVATTCFACGGTGSLICPACKGQKGSATKCSACQGAGSLVCPTCGGRKKIICPVCEGNYASKCPTCGGQGFFVETMNNLTVRSHCGRCGGKGEVYCANCKNGLVKCKACRAKGRLPCSACKGKGTMFQECATCGGTGEVQCPSCGGTGAPRK